MTKEETTASQQPSDLVIVGRLSGAYGVRGWVRIKPFSRNADALLQVKKWWIDRPQWREVNVLNARWQGDEVVAQLVSVSDRDIAEALRGATISISRKLFPVTDANEYYWVDLIGMLVFNQQQELLGVVENLIDNME